MIAICAAGALPLFASHVLGVNHLMRLVSPALLPLLLGAAIVAQLAQLPIVRLAAGTAAVVMVLQGIYVARSFATTDIDFWNWEPLLRACDSHGIRSPRIAYLGQGTTFNGAAIGYPWVSRDRIVVEHWLWGYEDGSIDWMSVMSKVNGADVVITAPGYGGEAADHEDLDNVHNVELVERMRTLPDFGPPEELQLGQHHTRVLVFLRAAKSPTAPGTS
jgi:hypothetical protein